MNVLRIRGFVAAVIEEGDGYNVLFVSKRKGHEDAPWIHFDEVPFKKGDFAEIEARFEQREYNGIPVQSIIGVSAVPVFMSFKNEFQVDGIVAKKREDERMTKLWVTPDGEKGQIRFVLYGRTDIHAGDHVSLHGMVQTSRKGEGKEGGKPAVFRNLVVWEAEKTEKPGEKGN